MGIFFLMWYLTSSYNSGLFKTQKLVTRSTSESIMDPCWEYESVQCRDTTLHVLYMEQFQTHTYHHHHHQQYHQPTLCPTLLHPISLSLLKCIDNLNRMGLQACVVSTYCIRTALLRTETTLTMLRRDCQKENKSYFNRSFKCLRSQLFFCSFRWSFPSF